MKNNKFVITKVPLHNFISILNDLYMKGADYADFNVELNMNKDNTIKDRITVSLKKEYYSDEAQQSMEEYNKKNQPPAPPGIVVEEEENVEEENSPLTEEDIKDILIYG